MTHLFFAMCLTAAVAGDGQTGLPRRSAGEAGPTVEGAWRADSDHDWTRSNNERWISIQFQHDGSNNGIGIPGRDVPALADRRSDGPIHFTLRRDAGTFDFTGRLADGRGRGDFRFYGGITIEKLVQFRIHGVDADLIRRAKAHGFNDLSAEDLVDLAIHGRRWLKTDCEL